MGCRLQVFWVEIFLEFLHRGFRFLGFLCCSRWRVLGRLFLGREIPVRGLPMILFWFGERLCLQVGIFWFSYIGDADKI